MTFGLTCTESGKMTNIKSVKQQPKMTAQDHIREADDYISAADDRNNDPAWALVEVELAKAHLIAAAVKMANELMGGKRPAGVLGLVAKLAT
jgi:hypothetical protein